MSNINRKLHEQKSCKVGTIYLEGRRCMLLCGSTSQGWQTGRPVQVTALDWKSAEYMYLSEVPKKLSQGAFFCWLAAGCSGCDKDVHLVL